MQTSILRSLALVAVGNAALAGRDVSAFWPRSELFRHTKQIEFLLSDEKGAFALAAQNPNAWFAALAQMGCRGLRLHAAPMLQREGMAPQSERMLVGLVGGGPRWLIEAIYPARTEIWEGYDRLGDRDDPAQKIWLSAYLMLGEIEPQDEAVDDIAAAAVQVRAALGAIEAFARTLEGTPFAAAFAEAAAVLDGAPHERASLDFLALTALAPPARRLIAGVEAAWVFGAMGSWNDIAVSPNQKEDYARVSDALFTALCVAVEAAANSSFSGGRG